MQGEGGQDTQENPALSLGFIFLADNHHTEAAVPSCLTENMIIYNNSERNVTQAYVRRVHKYVSSTKNSVINMIHAAASMLCGAANVWKTVKSSHTQNLQSDES